MSFPFFPASTIFAHMITEQLIRKKFIHQTMTSAINRLYAAWRPAVSVFQIRSGELSRFASSGAAYRHISNGTYELKFFLPLHLRFLDIQYRRRKPKGKQAREHSNLYNKIVWPAIFRHVFPELKYGLTDEVREGLYRELKRAVEI